LIGEWNFPRVSLSIRILILISIGEKNHLDFHWFMKDDGPLIGGKDLQLSLDKKASSRKGLGGVPRGKKSILCFGGKQRRRMIM
jgi:hypothetical protein